MSAKPMCTHAGVVSQDECPYCNPTPRPWKERREEIEELLRVWTAAPSRPHDMLRDCLREIDRRGEMIGRLAMHVRHSHVDAHTPTESTRFSCPICLIISEANEVTTHA